jgi:diacylglycerol kinase (ATP)
MAKNRTLLHALNNAVEGFIHVLRSERNMRIHFFAAFIILLLAFFFGVQRQDWLTLCLAVCLVLVAEMINTAIEQTLDLLHSRYSPQVGVIKDISAGMVLVAVINALIVGFFIFARYWKSPFEFVATRLRHSEGYLLFISALVAVLLVVYGKAQGKKGTPFRGGVISGHSAVAFSLWTVLVFTVTDLFVLAVGLLLALLVAQSRLKSKIHSFWEVAAGAVVGISVTAFFFKLFL